jgi:hypothetical protein
MRGEWRAGQCYWNANVPISWWHSTKSTKVKAYVVGNDVQN